MDVIAGVLESFLRNNIGLIKKIPGAETLAGIIEEDTRQREEEKKQKVSEKNPSPEDPAGSDLNEKQKVWLKMLEDFQNGLSAEDFILVLGMLSECLDHPERIKEGAATFIKWMQEKDKG